MGLNTTRSRWIVRDGKTIVHTTTDHGEAFAELIGVVDRLGDKVDHARGVTEALNRLEIMENTNVEITFAVQGTARTLSVRRSLSLPARTDDPFAAFDNVA